MTQTRSLKRRSVQAGAWTGGANVIGQLLRFIGNLVLARLLTPDAFGLMAVVSTLMLGLNLLSDIGTGPTIIQSPRGAERVFLDTAWTMQVVRGIGLWLFGLVIAYAIATGQARHWFSAGTAYSDGRLPHLIAVATFGLAILGFNSINQRSAERNLDFRRVVSVELIAQLFALCLMIAVAALTGSVWALILGGLLSASLRCALSHLMLQGPLPSIRLEPSAVRELLGTGKWVLLSSLLGFFALSGDRLLLGGIVDATTLGLYSIAFALAGMAPTAFSAVLSRVVLPAFSEVWRERRPDLPRTYKKFQQLTDAGVGLVAGLLYASSDALISLLYDPRYQGAGVILAYLAIGSIGMRAVVIEQLYLATGQPRLLGLAAVPRVITLLVGVPAGYALWQLNGALAAIVVSQFAQWPQALWYRWRLKVSDSRTDLLLPVAAMSGWALGWLALYLTSTWTPR